MSYLDAGNPLAVENAAPHVRADFIRKVYIHLVIGILLFAGLEALYLQMGFGAIAMKLISVHQYAWLGVLLVYGVASYFMSKWAHSAITKEQQYLAFFGGVFLESLIFLPLISIAVFYAPDTLQHAVVATLALVAGLTMTVVITGKSFHFLMPVLMIVGCVALGLIVASILFGFQLGLWFSAIMIVFASAAILYETSKIFKDYSEHQYIGAALTLFASVGLLFWYVLQVALHFIGED